MGCLISFKFWFAIAGWRAAGGRGLFLGFLLGCLLDSIFNRPKIHFTYRTINPEDIFGQYQQQTYQPPLQTDKLREAYKTLGVGEDATDDEIRQAYRRLALRYHPDRVASQGEQERQAAERIFQQIGEAKDIIFKARGMK